VTTEKITLDIKRFSDLGSEMIGLLSTLSQEINSAAADLQSVQTALDLKKKELATLNEIEMVAASLEKQIQDLRQQKENLDHVIAEQRVAWEKERDRRAREEKEYIENLNARRQKEEQEYQQSRAAELEQSRRLLEDELRAIQQEKQEAQTAIETNLQERELLLKKKELEWGQLIQELEQFLFKLEKRHRLHDTLHAVWTNGTLEEQLGQPSPALPPSGTIHKEPKYSALDDENDAGAGPEDLSVQENIGEDGFPPDGGNEPGSGGDCEEDTKHSQLARRDSTPLKFCPKRSLNLKSDS